MFRPLSIFIGLRYTRAKRRNHFISFISLVSMLGIIVGVTALITVMSVMNGFDSDMRSRIVGAVSDATITGVGESISDWQRALDVANATPQVKGAAPYVESQAFLVGLRSHGALVRGVMPSLEPRVSDFNTHMKAGHFDALRPGSWNVLLGDELAMRLGVSVGDKVTVYAPRFRATPMGGVPLLRRFTVAGIFSMGMQDYDSGLVLMNMQDAEKLYQLHGPTGIRLSLQDMFDAWPVAQKLSNTLGQDYRVRTWMQTHLNLFKALRMEKMVMFLILSLIIGVATFNLVSTLVMLVTDKQADIAILRTLGATPRTIMGVFMVQGMTVGLFGIILGMVFGVLLSLNVPAIVDWIQSVFHVQFLSPDVYYISEVPSRLDWHDVGWVGSMAFVLCLLATIYPAWRASRTQPAQALRYE